MAGSRRKFTKEFKEEAVRRLELGALAEVARACEVPTCGTGGGANCALPRPHRIGRPRYLENPRPKGGILASGERPRSISGYQITGTRLTRALFYWRHKSRSGVCPVNS